MDYKVPCIYNKITRPAQSVCVPGSKSITARALLMAALARGRSTLCGAQVSGDCLEFIEGLRSLGIDVAYEGSVVSVDGCGGSLPEKRASVYVGSAGTAARFLTALAALSDGEYDFDCSEQMRRRPMAPLISALRDMGARFTFGGEPDCFPFTVRGTSRPAETVVVDIRSSSQYLSALLMCAPCTGRSLTVQTKGSHGMDYVRMTADMMWSFGADVREEEGRFVVSGSYSAKRYDIEPDVSAACYFYAASRILGADVSVRGVMPHTMQGDYKFIELLKHFDGGEVDMSSFSDQALTLAAAAPYFSSPTIITGIGHVRGQECDRIKAIVANLSALGVRAEEREDGVKICPSEPVGCALESFGDHRVAMAFAVTGLRCGGVTIRNAEVCGKTFKNYFDVLDDLAARLTS